MFSTGVEKAVSQIFHYRRSHNSCIVRSISILGLIRLASFFVRSVNILKLLGSTSFQVCTVIDILMVVGSESTSGQEVI